MINANDIINGPRITLRRINIPLCEKIIPIIHRAVLARPDHFGPYNPVWTDVPQIEVIGRTYKNKHQDNYRYGVAVTYFIFCHDVFLGHIGAYSLPPRTEYAIVECFLMPHATGRGYMNESMTLMENEFFTKMNFSATTAIIHHKNTPSLKFFQKLNYSPNAGIRDYITTTLNNVAQSDVVVYSKLKSKWEQGR